jgi:hypothetical protein
MVTKDMAKAEKKFRKMPTINRKAWTGGSKPLPILELGREERRYVSFLFREQLTIWHDYWGDYPNNDTRHIFWNRARFDAHATFRRKG